MLADIGQITIIGVGHIGGSIGLALRKRGYTGKIIGVGRTRKNLETALNEGCIDEVDDEDLKKTRNSDLVVLCTPVRSINLWFGKIKQLEGFNSIITDAGSVKYPLVREAIKLRIANYVPAHPIAGRETTGAGSADPDLYANKLCIITPMPGVKRSVLQKVKTFWTSIGCKVIAMTPESHDLLLAYTSHLPHALAYALVALLSRKYNHREIISGGGLRDFTRIASSSPEMWRDIFFENKGNTLRSIKDIEKEFKKIEKFLINDDAEGLLNYLERAKNFRDRIFKK